MMILVLLKHYTVIFYFLKLMYTDKKKRKMEDTAINHLAIIPVQPIIRWNLKV